MKPNIFFSHSARDAERILPIKNHLIEKMGNTIEIFMSSDGASIPFGKNWVKEIEEALKECKLMFVWLTPNSAQSNWVHFEAGHAYSRDIKVVPLGFDGINLEKVPGPLRFLQGFNVKSAASLNNLTAIINREFDYTFKDFFDEDFFDNVVNYGLIENSEELLLYISRMQAVFPTFLTLRAREIEGGSRRTGPIEKLEKFLNSKKAVLSKADSGLFGQGYKVNLDSDYDLLDIDPLVLNEFYPLLMEIYSELYEGESFIGFILHIIPNKPFRFINDTFLVSSRLANTEVEFDTVRPNIDFRFRNILFRLIKRKVKYNLMTREEIILVVSVDRDNKDPLPLLSLLKLLKSRGILLSDEWWADGYP